jgi:predicted metal-dependent phosphoesterase TrpH
MAIGCAFLGAALAAGTWADEARPAGGRTIGEYQVLATDFHVHSFPFSWSTLSVFDTVIDARHQGLDAIALTPHNHLWVAHVGQWFSKAIGGPTVVAGEEITAAGYHMLALGLHDVVPSTLPAAAAIDAIHRQGGVAIAAHPYRKSWPAYDAAALATLDASEIVRPDSRRDERAAAELRTFFARGRFTAIGATDYHGLGPVGYGRTYVFARERSQQGVIDAVRDGRTVVYDGRRAYGDAALIQLAAASGGFPQDGPGFPRRGRLPAFSRLATVLALAGMLLFNRR